MSHTNRFAAALASLNIPAPDMVMLSSNLYGAVLEAITYEKDPITDPAVLLLSMQIGFATHADFATTATYDKLVETCRVNAAQPVINPKEVH